MKDNNTQVSAVVAIKSSSANHITDESKNPILNSSTVSGCQIQVGAQSPHAFYLPYIPEPSNAKHADKAERRRAVKTIALCLFALALYDFVSALTVFLAQIGVVGFFGTNIAESIFENHYFQYGLQILALYVIGLSAFMLVTARLPKAESKKCSRLGFGKFILIFIVMYGLANIVSHIASTIEGILTLALDDFIIYEVPESIINPDVPLELLILVAVIIGPIIEELVFRKVLIDRLSVYGDRFALIFTSITFGIFHGNITQGLYTIVGGFFFGYVYIKTRKLGASVALHMLMNFVGSVPALLLQSGLEDLPENFESLGAEQMMEHLPTILGILLVGIMNILFMVGAIIILIIALSKGSIRVRKEGEIILRKRTVIHACFFTLGAWLFVAVMFFNYTASLGITLDYISEIYLLIAKMIGG